MARGNQTVNNRVYDVPMSGEELASSRRDLDPNFILRRNQGAPGAGKVGLAGNGKDEAVYHPAHHGWIRAILLDRGGVVRRVDDRLVRNDLGLRADGDGKEKQG